MVETAFIGYIMVANLRNCAKLKLNVCLNSPHERHSKSLHTQRAQTEMTFTYRPRCAGGEYIPVKHVVGI